MTRFIWLIIGILLSLMFVTAQSPNSIEDRNVERCNDLAHAMYLEATNLSLLQTEQEKRLNAAIAYQEIHAMGYECE